MSTYRSLLPRMDTIASRVNKHRQSVQSSLVVSDYVIAVSVYDSRRRRSAVNIVAE